MGHTKHYILSEDLDILMKEWGEVRGFRIPESSFFHHMHEALADQVQGVLGSDVEVLSVSARDIDSGIARLLQVHHNGLPFISLDRHCYGDNEGVLFYDVNRVVDVEFEDIGIANRPGTQSQVEQLSSIADQLPPGCRKVGVIDDGCFTAGTLNTFVEEAGIVGLEVETILLGLVIHGEKLPWDDCDIHYLQFYHPGHDVVDWVWDRDFYPGVPLSGRTVGQLVDGKPVPFEPSQGACYLCGFGDIGAWASIPFEGQISLTEFCLEQDIRMFEEIEDLSSRVVKMTDLDRWPFGIKFSPDERAVDVLVRELRGLEDLVSGERGVVSLYPKSLR